jgi:eukaryotic-like serine/threonine-protein kinase
MRPEPSHTQTHVGDVIPLPRVRRARYGEYEVIAPLAHGGMAGVYLAEHVATGERVALKILDPHLTDHTEVVERLHAEHALASRTQHPGVLDIHAARHTPDGTPYLVMEYLDAETLAEVVARGPLDVATTVAICAQLASALAALHAAGVIHCDVKHDNVLVLRDSGRVKLIDFGVSRTVDDPIDEHAGVAGTPWCMAPEQWQGRPIPASDVYALGCLLFDLVTGVPPFDGSLPELMLAHLERRPARPSWLASRPIPVELERVILRALAKLPEHRPTMADLAIELTELADALAPAPLRASA